MSRNRPALGGTLQKVAAVLAALLFVGSAAYGIDIEAFRQQNSTALEVCRPVGTPSPISSIGQGAIYIYGIHVTNSTASPVYLQLFPLSQTSPLGTPSASSTPIGLVSWQVPASGNIDVDISSIMGLSSATGINVCTSTAQTNFQATGSTSSFMVLYR